MKNLNIEFSKDNMETVAFEELKYGELFLYNNQYYINTDEKNKAMLLNTGILFPFIPSIKVYLIKEYKVTFEKKLLRYVKTSIRELLEDYFNKNSEYEYFIQYNCRRESDEDDNFHKITEISFPNLEIKTSFWNKWEEEDIHILNNYVDRLFRKKK